MQSLHGHKIGLGLKNQVFFKIEWERVTALPKTQVQSLHSLHDHDFINWTHKMTTSQVPYEVDT